MRVWLDKPTANGLTNGENLILFGVSIVILVGMFLA